VNVTLTPTLVLTLTVKTLPFPQFFFSLSLSFFSFNRSSSSWIAMDRLLFVSLGLCLLFCTHAIAQCRIKALRDAADFDCDGNVTEGDTCTIPATILATVDNFFTRKVREARLEEEGESG
jgi:hypothetical protein